MKSKRSFFNPGICRNLLRRFWPLWAGYGLLLLLTLPGLSSLAWMEETLSDVVNAMVLQSAGTFLVFAFFMGLLTTRFLFGYLFEKRGTGMMASLPVRRESVFFTVWLTGLIPTLALNLQWILLVWLLRVWTGMTLASLGLWLLVTTCGLLCFYGIGVFCAMLTGNRVLFPLLYLALNFGAALLEVCVRHVLRVIIYGLPDESGKLLWLSPPIEMIADVSVMREPTLHLEGVGTVLAYGAVGLALTGAALLLYRKRHMETATDNIAVRWLKPVFRYGLGVANAFALGSLGCSILLSRSGGFGAALTALILMLCGAFIGYFAAEMLLQKTVKVFRGRWKGFALICAGLLLFVGCTEFDLFGYERRVPAPAEVESVRVYWSYNDLENFELKGQEGLELVHAAHQGYLEHRAINERAEGYHKTISFTYTLKNGRTLTREYPSPLGSGTLNEIRLDLPAVNAVLNCDEAQEYRFEKLLLRNGMTGMYLRVRSYIGENSYSVHRIDLSSLESASLYRAMTPDLQAHTLGRVWLTEEDEETLRQKTNVEIVVSVQRDDTVVTRSFPVCVDSENCLRWLREHTDIEVLSLKEAMDRAG